jgi:hypothetical protein
MSNHAATNIMKQAIAVVITSSVLLMAGCATSNKVQTESGHQVSVWEYKVVQGWLGNGEFQAAINKAADEGWILVSAGSPSENRLFAVLKRAKR